MATDRETVASAFERMGIAAAVVTVVRADGSAHGSTGMAWAEFPDPPLVLTTLARTGTTMEILESSGCFGINVLGATQHELVWQFARSGDRFAGVPTRRGPVLDLPLLEHAVVRLECRVVDVHPFGGHNIVVGQVESADVSPDGTPVVHFAGRLWSLAPIHARS